MSMALRMSSDLVAAIFVGGGIGYLLDHWCNTQPWMTVIFFVFGTAAGFRNLYRIAMGSDQNNTKTGNRSRP
ncbi:MAG: AtpZ/AtpI family protein [Magnetococcales bacterium]|nr:AtpZ/AtpI family protein [Magnetococcales bacterium]